MQIKLIIKSKHLAIQPTIMDDLSDRSSPIFSN